MIFPLKKMVLIKLPILFMVFLIKNVKFSLKKKIVKKKKIWFDYDLNTMKRLVDEKAKFMSKFPKDSIVRGSFFNDNKKYAKLRGKKKRV